MPLSLADTIARALSLLEQAAADPASAFHTPTLASVGADGSPALRTVVLRGFASDMRRAEMHTDTRSAKVQQFRTRDRAALHGWDPVRRVQLRLHGTMRLHMRDQVTEAAWARLRPSSRATYCVEPGPGQAIETPHDTHAVTEDAGFAVFCVMYLHFDELEWLHLEHGRHERARCRWDNGLATPMWLVP